MLGRQKVFESYSYALVSSCKLFVDKVMMQMDYTSDVKRLLRREQMYMYIYLITKRVVARHRRTKPPSPLLLLLVLSGTKPGANTKVVRITLVVFRALGVSAASQHLKIVFSLHDIGDVPGWDAGG